MLKIIPFGLCLCLLTAPVYANELTAERAIQEEFEQNRNKISEIFQDKVQKISARTALPEDMRNLLISQADEVRQFDLYVLHRKLDMKLRHAKARDDMKEQLREDAQNRAKWMLEDEENFQELKEARQKAEEKILRDVEEDRKAADEKKSENKADPKENDVNTDEQTSKEK